MTIAQNNLVSAPNSRSHLADPQPSLLADFLASRLAAEQEAPPVPDILADPMLALRPVMPKIGLKALFLYLHRSRVQSFPLLFTTLAVAHPN